MTVLKGASYQWYLYKAKDVYLLESARGQQASLIKGRLFGLRKAGSKKDVYRLILKELGPGTVFSLLQPAVLDLLKKSAAAPEGAAQPDPRAKKLLARLQKIDPKDFWAVVAALDWPKAGKDNDYAALAKSALRERYRLQDVKWLARTAARKRRDLHKAVEKLERQARQQLFLGGDDSLYDALALAVSHGQDRYESFLRKPESFIKKFNGVRIDQHNFEYCFD
ncbi:hypothetical protein [Pseudomonas sp. CGJS7]|uniref:hypothetical protein n=1 Tax=Pseudomonas sp. CGJS7 TaxID=3109348 RepID=UPI003007F7E7